MTGFRDRLAYDGAKGTYHDEARRYMMIRPEALMGIFARLPADARMQALGALRASILEQGSDSARAYVAHAGSAEGLMKIIPHTAAELGWGAWTLKRTGDALDLAVTDSPFAAGFGASETPVCEAIAGMLQGVAGIMSGQVSVAVETQCAAQGHATCRFSAHPVGETQ